MAIGVGVIGYGLSAKIFHIPFILASPAFSLHAVVQRSPNASSSAPADHPSAKHYTSTEELFADADVKLVVITTPPATHFSLASAAIRAGKNVLVEKPFTLTSKDAYELVRQAKEANVVLTVYQNRRYDADFQALKALIESDRFGRVVDFESHFDRHRPEGGRGGWKADPDAYSAVWDLGTHLMDQVVSIYGFPSKITGFVGSQRGEAVEDSFTSLLHYPNGLTATVRASVVSPEKNQLRYWVRGTKGGFKKFHLDPQEDQLKDGLRPGNNGYGVESQDKWGVLTLAEEGTFKEETIETKPGRGYTGFYEDLGKALQGQGTAPVDASVAAGVIRLCELMKESSQAGKSLEVNL